MIFSVQKHHCILFSNESRWLWCLQCGIESIFVKNDGLCPYLSRCCKALCNTSSTQLQHTWSMMDVGKGSHESIRISFDYWNHLNEYIVTKIRRFHVKCECWCWAHFVQDADNLQPTKTRPIMVESMAKWDQHSCDTKPVVLMSEMRGITPVFVVSSCWTSDSDAANVTHWQTILSSSLVVHSRLTLQAVTHEMNPR